MVFVNTFSVGLHSYAWLTLLGFFFHMASLGSSNRQRLQEAADHGRFREMPEHVVGIQAMWDQTRLGISHLVWVTLTAPVVWFISAGLPRELRVYAAPVPIFNLGQDVELGIAAHFAPRHGNSNSHEGVPERWRGRQPKPKHFVCNVGQISHADQRGLQDVQRTMNTLREVWEEFKQPSVRGLVANVVAVFPQLEEGLTKEINLSAWESSAEAHDWYVNSPGHRRVMHQHGSGLLQTFGNLLASLDPSAPIRYQDRCRHCAIVVEAKEFGLRPPKRCGVCGGPTFRYPYF